MYGFRSKTIVVFVNGVVFFVKGLRLRAVAECVLFDGGGSDEPELDGFELDVSEYDNNFCRDFDGDNSELDDSELDNSGSEDECLSLVSLCGV